MLLVVRSARLEPIGNEVNECALIVFLPCACHSAAPMIALACSSPTLESLEHLKFQTHHFHIRPIVQGDIQQQSTILFMFTFDGQEQQWKKCSYLKDRASNENFDLSHIKLLTYSTSLSRSRSTFESLSYRQT